MYVADVYQPCYLAQKGGDRDEIACAEGLESGSWCTHLALELVVLEVQDRADIVVRHPDSLDP